MVDDVRNVDALDVVSRGLFRYILLVATLAFTGRALPLSFLPIVLQTDFKQSGTVVGIVMAIYPLGALVITPVAARVARGTQRIVALHSLAIIAVAIAMLLTSVTPVVHSWFGNLCAVLWLSLCRLAQGMGVSLYLAANTSLITRRFAHQLPYTVAMTEVCVGAGSQLGRVVGGFLFDVGGFALPFVLVGIGQVLVGTWGFRFEETREANVPECEAEPASEGEQRSTPMRELITLRVCLGGLCAFLIYFASAFLDAVLPQYLMVRLAPVTVGVISLCLSLRGLCYITGSWVVAQLMHRRLVSFEVAVLCGLLGTSGGILLFGPQRVVAYVELLLAGTASMSLLLRWITVVLAICVFSPSAATTFVVSLPLMQSEVSRLGHGNVELEKVAEIFVTMMSLGEMTGPIFGGWLVSEVGFIIGTFILACFYWALLCLAVVSFDPAMIRARDGHHHPLVAPVLTPVEVKDTAGCADGCAPRCVPLIVPSDEVSFVFRRIPFALDEQRRHRHVLPGSAPSSVFRRRGLPATAAKPFMTVPSHGFRRKYEPPVLGTTAPN